MQLYVCPYFLGFADLPVLSGFQSFVLPSVLNTVNSSKLTGSPNDFHTLALFSTCIIRTASSSLTLSLVAGRTCDGGPTCLAVLMSWAAQAGVRRGELWAVAWQPTRLGGLPTWHSLRKIYVLMLAKIRGIVWWRWNCFLLEIYVLMLSKICASNIPKIFYVILLFNWKIYLAILNLHVQNVADCRVIRARGIYRLCSL